MEPMSDAMKEEYLRRKESEKIYKKIHTQRRTKYPERKREVHLLPEGFTGQDLKKLLKLIKGRKLKKKRREKNG